MGLEQLALAFLLNNMGHVDDIKKHLIAGLREMALATASSLAILNRTAADTDLAGRFPLANVLIKKADALLQHACAKIPAPDEAARLKSEVLGSVIEVLDEESQRLKREPGPSSALQREALNSLRRALAKRLGDDAAAGDHDVENDALSTLFSARARRPATL